MERIRSRFRRARHLNRTGAAVLRRERVHLNAGFLDRVWIWGEVQYALSNAAVYVESIDNVLVGHDALTVRAHIHRGFSRIVIYARAGGSSTTRRAAAHGSES